MLKGVDILLTVSHSVPPSVVPYNSPAKFVCSNDANESSDDSSMNLLGWVGGSDTEDTTNFLLNSLYSDVMVMDLWWLLGIISIFLDTPYSYFVMRYPASRMRQ